MNDFKNHKTALVLAPIFWPNQAPLSLVCLGSYLLSKDQDVSVYDLNNKFFNLASDELKKQWLISANSSLEENIFNIIQEKFKVEYEQFLNQIASNKIVGFSCYKSNLKTTFKIAEQLKEKNPNIKVVIGGPEITRHYLKDKTVFETEKFSFADLIIVGEGEKPLYDFIQGTTYQRIVCFEELKTLNFYNPVTGYQLLNLSDYPKKNRASLLLNRGCLRICRFCSERLLYKEARTRSIENVIDEIAILIQKYSVEYFVFHDSMLNMNSARLERLCQAIINKFGKINWEAQMGVQPKMSDELLARVAESGCYNLFIGLESGCNNTLEDMRKGFSSMDALMFFKKLKKAGLSYGVSLIVGFPGETEEDAKESLDFLIENKEYIPKIEQINPYVHYDGTDLNKEDDYRHNKKIIERTEKFVQELKNHGFKITNAFINNLVEK